MSMEHVETLRLVREQMVCGRRAFAKTLTKPYERGRTEERIQKFMAMQEAIEVIDRAIADEMTSPRAAANDETLYDQFAKRG